MSHPQASFAAQFHAHTLAAVWLTRNYDLRVLDQNRDVFGFELLAAVAKDGRFSGRQFAVVVKAGGVRESPPRLGARELRRERERFADLTVPLCMLAFPTSGEPGWFRWILEPATCAGCTELRFADCIGFEPATDELLTRVVGQVNRWYDARRETGAVAT